MGASLASVLGGLGVVAGLADFARDVLVRAEFLEDFGETFVLLLAVKPFNGLLDFRRVGHDDLHVALGGKMDFIRARRVERLGQRDLQRAVVQRDRQALIHLRDCWRESA